ncbi:MAG: thiol:disulfide interchange protein DsbA/DsbL [Rhodocyclaceae bacterium]|nr:thiol:disulfide interchange protein DsbA/DsbL [Rhodocyclaceae bacterium]
MIVLQRLVGHLTLMATLFLAGAATAAPVEGKDYVAVPLPQAQAAGSGKIEVTEFFWYGCPHCFALEPKLAAWLANQPKDVQFRRVPAVLAAHWQPMAKAFYALDATGTDLHAKIFNAIHLEKFNLDDEKTFLQWVGKQGADSAKVGDAYRSFGVQSKVQAARQMNVNFGLTSVPSLVVAGKYMTSPSMAGGADQMFEVVDYLVEQARKKR